MQGYKVLWVPGCDHAGIATQVSHLYICEIVKENAEVAFSMYIICSEYSLMCLCVLVCGGKEAVEGTGEVQTGL